MLSEDQVRAIYAESMKHRDPVPYIHRAIEAAAVRAEQSKLNEEYDSVLRGLASYVGAGGFDDPSALIDPKVADEKIRWGIDHMLKIEQAEQEPVAYVVDRENCRVWWNDRYTHISQAPKNDTPLYAAPVVQPDMVKAVKALLEKLPQPGSRNWPHFYAMAELKAVHDMVAAAEKEQR